MLTFHPYQRLRILPGLILFSILIYSCSIFSDPENDHKNGISAGERLKGAIYFNVLNPHQIIRYVPALNTFEVIADQDKSPAAMSVSKNHRYLSFRKGENSIHFIDLESGLERVYTSSYQLLDDLTMDGDGGLLVCPAIVGVDTTVLLVYSDSFQEEIFDAWQYRGVRDVLFSHTNFNLAWMSSRGLFLRNLTTPDIRHITTDVLPPDDFSPSGRYLAAGGRIFSTQDGQLYPGKVSGRIKFIDDRFVLFNEEGSNVIKIANLSGTTIIDLYESLFREALFSVSPEGSFAAILDKDETELILVLLDLETKDILRSVRFSLTSQTLAGDFFWRYPPLLSRP